MQPIQIKNDGGAQYKAHNQWAKRPSDERFLSLLDMQAHFELIRSRSRGVVVSSHRVQLQPGYYNSESGEAISPDSPLGNHTTGLQLTGSNGHGYEPTNWSFGQLATLSGAPAGYLRTLPVEMAADCINYGLRFNRQAEEIGCLLYSNGNRELRAATGPRYGRIWNSDVLRALVNYVGDGVSGTWKVPGEFGKAIEVNKDNTTLYASDRDMFVFLADEENRIMVPNRRDGKSGSLARGIYVWNSEVGASTFGVGLFLFDFACCNRIVWGMEQYKEFTFRHTAAAPDRFLSEIRPALKAYSQASSVSIDDAIQAAQADKLNDVKEFLATRFGPRVAQQIHTVHELEEGRPVETRWDAVVGATAYARGIEHQDTRVDFERTAGALLKR